MMITVGFDWSMSSPAVCVMVTDKRGNVIWDQTRMFGLVHTKKGAIDAPNTVLERYDDVVTHTDTTGRFVDLARWGVQAAMCYGMPDVVAIEDYAYTKSGRVFHIGENGGILKHHLYLEGIEPTVVGPTVVKKFAFSGNATKNQMYDAFCEHTPINICEQIQYKKVKVTNPLEDLVDAYWVARWASLNGQTPT